MSDIVTLNGYKIKDEKAVRSYDTIALMKADTKLKEGYHVKTKGYYEANDGGHGEYVIVDDETLVDDGGLIHVLNNGLRAKLILENDKINIKQLGAKCDGITNDSDKFISAINNFNTIIIPNNLLLSSTNLQFTNLENKKLIGRNNALIEVSYSSEHYFQFSNSNNITLENINIKSSGNASAILFFSDSNNIFINNSSFDGSGYVNGVRDNTQINHGLSFTNCENVTFKDNKVKNIQFRYGIIFTNSKNVIIKNNYFNYIGGSAIELSNSNKHFVIDGNICKYCNITDLGSDLSSVTDGVIDTYGKLDNETDYNKDINIINNIINYYGVQQIPNSGIRVSGSKDVNVIGNIIKNHLVSDNYGGYYILIQDRNNNSSSNINISDNQFICDDSSCYPSVCRFQHTGLNTKFNNNIFDSIVNYSTQSRQIIYVMNSVIEMEIKNNKIGNQTNITQGVPIYVNGKHIEIVNNILNTSYRGIIVSGGQYVNIIGNQVNNGHNYAIQINDSSDNVKVIYNRITMTNGIVKIDENCTNTDEIGTYKWIEV